MVYPHDALDAPEIMTDTKRLSVTLDSDLLEAAVRATGADSQREAIEEALRELVRRRAVERMARRGGTVELDRTVEELLDDRERG